MSEEESAKGEGERGTEPETETAIPDQSSTNASQYTTV